MVTEYKDILLNECGDTKIDEGDIVLVSGVDAIRQAWLIHIRTFLGEWFLNLNKGVPYIQKVFAKKLTRAEVQRIFYVASLEVPGIKRVNNVIIESLDVATRAMELTVDAVCDNVEGSVTFKYKGTLPPDSCAPIASSDFPLTLGDLRVWFDAQDLANLTYTGSALTLQNKAGAGEATGEGAGANIPALVGATPLNGKRAIYFDNPNGGSNDEFLRFLNTPAIRHGSGALSIVIVCKPEDPSGAPYGRGLVGLSGFETTNYNREGYNIYEKIPIPDSEAVFKSVPQSVLIDGAMEKSGVTDWTAINGATLTKETTNPHRGNNVLKIAYTTTNSPGARQTVLTANKSYRCKGYARGDGGSGMPWINFGGASWYGSSSTSWQAFDVSWRAVSSQINFYAQNVGPYAEFDEITIERLIIADGNMETSDVTSWTASPGSTASKQTGSPYEGTRVLRVSHPSGNSAVRQDSLTAGKTYRLKGVCRGDGASTYPEIREGDSTWTLFNSLFTGTTSNSWQAFDVVFTAGYTNLILRANVAGYAEFDAIEIEEVAAESITPANAFDPAILSFMRDASDNLEIFRDGVSLGMTANISERLLDGDGVIGALLSQADFYTAENFFHGYIGEVLIYEGEISATDLTNLHNFLLNKWSF